MSQTQKKKNPSNIVPLKTRPQMNLEELSPQLVYNGGPLLTSVEVFTIFWGQNWNNDQVKDLPTKIGEFFKFIVTSKLIEQMSEYNTDKYKIGHGKFIGSANITTPALEDTVSDDEIQEFLRNNIRSKTIPSPTDNSLYFVYLPPGVTSTLGASDESCLTYCGYHEFFKLDEADANSKNVYYAVMPYPECGGCHADEPTDFDSLTVTSSHELCEAITDPEISIKVNSAFGTGWHVNNPDGSGGEENGDICHRTRGRIGGFLVQKEYSNKEGCILNT